MANLVEKVWDKWAKEMQNKGIDMNGLLPNLIAVLAIMDELFRLFKDSLKHSTHEHLSTKIKANATKLTRLKAELAQTIANREAVTDKDKAKTRSVVSLTLMDLGHILFGDLTKDGYANQSSQVSEKALPRKMCFKPTESLAVNHIAKQFCKTRHLGMKLVKKKETNQTRRKQEMET